MFEIGVGMIFLEVVVCVVLDWWGGLEQKPLPKKKDTSYKNESYRNENRLVDWMALNAVVYAKCGEQ